MKRGSFTPWRVAILLSIAVLAIGFALAQSQGGGQPPGDTPESMAQTPAGMSSDAAQVSAAEPKEEPASETPVAASDAEAVTAAATADAEAAAQDAVAGRTVSRMRSTTQAQREAAVRNAARRRGALSKQGIQPQAGTATCTAALGTPCVQVDYFTSVPNYALSKFTEHVTSAANVLPKVHAVDTGIHKFQDGLAGLGPANKNNLNNYIPIATPMTNVWGNGGDYYEIGLKDYTQQFNTDLPATTQLRGYADLNPSPLPALGSGNASHYLGPFILAVKGTRVRVKFTNMLTNSLNQTGSPFFYIPGDTSYMGMSHTDLSNNKTWFSINRATLHLHGGATPWISDGTPHQWTVPVAEYAGSTVPVGYKRGASVQFVPDMYFNPTSHAAEAKTSTSTSDPGPGALSFLWTNDQSSRFMFYHDHAYGTTRLNVYGGEAAGYLLHDPTGLDTLIGTDIPNNAMFDATSDTLLAAVPNPGGATLTRATGGLYRFGIPLVIQDKTFVPPQAQLTAQDPSWNWGNEGNLWFPHVYMPNQNPNDDSGATIAGRWDYGPWFWPPMTSSDLAHGAITCQGAGDLAAYGATATCPGTLNPSGVPESFMDTPVVNGVAYPKVTLPAGAYRFQVLNAANDRMFNLSLFYAADALGNVCTTSAAYTGHNYAGGTNVQPATAACTEIRAVPAVPHPLIQSTTPAPLPAPGAETPADADDPMLACAATPTQPDVIRGTGFLVIANAPGTGNPSLPGHDIGGVDATNLGAINYNPNTGLPGTAASPCWPSSWPTDGRDGGVPDPATAGPPWVQIGTEGGILPLPVVIPPTPVGYNYNRRDIVVTNVQEHALFLGPAERADVIADLTNVPVGSTLILYNDSPAPVPGFDTRLDYYTGAPDLSSTGGSPTPQPGFGPNIRTIMQITIAAPTSPQSTFSLAGLKAHLPAKFNATQPAIIVPETTYAAEGIGVPAGTPAKDSYARIQNMDLKYTPIGGTQIDAPLLPKAIHELFENDYGKMNSILAEEIPLTNFNNQTTIPLAYVDPPTDIVGDGETQLWKVTHNGVDSHAIHFHLFNVQLINRVGWDGAIRPPDPNELGWKETVRMNPLEDAFVALKPVKMTLPTTPDFAIPESSRLLDVTRSPGATNATGLPGFTNVDPNGNPVTIVNAMNDFGWEYVWHCHLLGHEESDMMRPLVFKVATPIQPTNLTATIGGTVPFPTVRLNWQYTQGGTPGLTFTIVRTIGAAAATTIASGIPITTTTFTDLNAAAGATTTYQVFAVNGSALSAPATVAVTTLTPLATPGAITTTLLISTRVILQWVAPSPITGVTGYIIQRAPNTGTNASPVQGAFVNVGTSATTSFQNTGLVTNTIYWYRVQATGPGGNASAYSPVLQIHTP